jgi:hypothetical protein
MIGLTAFRRTAGLWLKEEARSRPAPCDPRPAFLSLSAKLLQIREVFRQ